MDPSYGPTPRKRKNFMPDAMGFDQRLDLHQTLRRFLRGSGDRSEGSGRPPDRLREFRFRPLPGNLSTSSVRQSRKARAARSKIFSESSESAKVRPLHWEPSRNTKRFRRSLAWSQVSELVLQILFNASGVVTRGVFFHDCRGGHSCSPPAPTARFSRGAPGRMGATLSATDL